MGGNLLSRFLIYRLFLNLTTQVMYNGIVHKKTNFVTITSQFIINIFFIIVSLTLIAATAYFFGFRLLRTPLLGNDAMNNLTYASWIAEHYPKLPLWYPLAGGGTSFLLGYPSLYSWSAAVLHKNSGLSLVQSMAVLNFASLLLPAWGVFGFVWWRFKMRPAALFAGIFYLLSPISYVLISGAGFLAHAYSFIFSAPFFIFYDIYLSSWLNRKPLSKKIIALIPAGLFFVLTTLAHPVSSLGFMVLFGFYSLLMGFFTNKLQGTKRGFMAIFTAGIAFYLMAFFWFKPFQDFTAFSNRDISFIANTETLPPVKFLGMLGLIGPQTGYPFPNLSVVPFIWILALVGLIMGLIKSNYKLFILSILVFFCFYLMGTYTIWIAFTKIHWLLGSFFVNRYYYTATAILPPIVAAVGLWYLITWPLTPLIRLIKKHAGIIAFPVNFIFSLSGIIIMLVITLSGLTYLSRFSGYHTKERPFMFHYGEESGIGLPFIWNRSLDGQGVRNYCDKDEKWYNGIFCENPALKGKVDISTLVYYCEGHASNNEVAQADICDAKKLAINEDNLRTGYPFVDEFINNCKIKKYKSSYHADLCLSVGTGLWDQLQKWPQIYLSDFSLHNLPTAEFSQKTHKLNWLSKYNVRIDTTPSLGSWTKEWNVVNRSGIINAYTGQLVLNKSFNSYFRDGMYTTDLVRNPEVVTELAKYFGISGIISSGSDQTEKFIKESWKGTKIADKTNLWQPPFPNNIYSLDSKTNVLVIGNNSKQAYKQIFQLATQGVIPYDTALLFEGNGQIDSYKQEELNKFKLIILHGYSYKNRNKAYAMLKNFLDSGGNIYMDTGWQYVSADWGKDTGMDMPDWFPVKKIRWGNAGNSWSNAVVDEQLVSDVDPWKFNPLTWGDTAWGLSYANESELSGNPLISINEKVIAAYKEVGLGKIIWTGFNLPAHSLNPENESEIDFSSQIIGYLLPKTEAKNYDKFSLNRIPDKITLKFNNSLSDQSTFYFKEAFHPYWKARIIGTDGSKKNLTVYNTGPRFMGVIVDQIKPNDQLEVYFDSRSPLIISATISLISLLLLLIILFDAVFLKNKILRLIPAIKFKHQNIATKAVKNQISKIKGSIEKDEEDY